ncbi:hypothetical protein AVEN_4026-1 [Araneus ventricosus]|uniref:Uncharacterized protein n=1 Tax=Araneus ventricosus TaxID=182803 RepID=A0A4Y2J4Y3_ARAVE|nr:hypothetical protein AVEN_4026-1 [Araneus ventricosus]
MPTSSLGLEGGEKEEKRHPLAERYTGAAKISARGCCVSSPYGRAATGNSRLNLGLPYVLVLSSESPAGRRFDLAF